jgi:hypothetical protein
VSDRPLPLVADRNHPELFDLSFWREHGRRRRLRPPHL